MTNWNHYVSTATISMDFKLGKMMPYFEELLPIMLFDPLIIFPCRITCQTKIISTNTTFIATKPGTEVINHERLQLIKSSKLLIMWCCKVMWQTETITSPLPQCLWPQNLVGWWLTWTASTHKVTWSCNYMVMPVAKNWAE